MSFKRLLPFLVVLVLLALLVLLKRGSQAPPSIETQANLQPLVASDLQAEDIARLELYAGANPDEKVVLEKDGEAWAARSHFDAPVDDTTLETYLESLAGLQGEFRAEAGSDEALADYALKEDEAFRVRAYKAGGDDPAADLLIGKAPGASTVFVRRAGEETVYVESTNLRRDAGVFGEDLAQAPEADKWLDKTALALERDAVDRIAIETPDKALVFEKRESETPAPEPAGDGEDSGEETPAPEPEPEWIMTAGGAEKDYKEGALQNIFNKLTNLTTTNIVDPARKADWGLESPGFKAVVSVADGDDVVIEGGRPDLAANGYIRVASNERDVVYELTSANFDQLFPKGSSLVELPAWEVEENTIASIAIEQPEGRITLVKEGEDWTVTEPDSALKPQQSTIDNLTGAVAAWAPSDYADSAEHAGAFDRVVRITTTGGDVRAFTAGNDALGADGAYARIDGEEQVLVMKAADVSRIFVKPRDLFQLALLDLSAEDVARVDVRADGESASLRHGEDAWTLGLDGTNYAADDTRAEKFLGILLDLEAADVNFGGTPSDITEAGAFSIVTRDGATRLLAYGAENDGVHPASLSGMRNTFTVAAADIDRLVTAFEDLRENKGEEMAAPEVPESEEAAEEAEGAPAEAAGEQPAAADTEARETTPKPEAADEAPAGTEGEEAPAEAEQPADGGASGN